MGRHPPLFIVDRFAVGRWIPDSRLVKGGANGGLQNRLAKSKEMCPHDRPEAGQIVEKHYFSKRPVEKKQPHCPKSPLQGGQGELRHRVVPASTPGMAAGNAAGRQPKPFKRTVFLKRLQPVLRAGRRKAAPWPQQGRDHPLVEFDQGNKWKGQYFKKDLHWRRWH